ncbi:hypothetical protein JY651_43460 [Pyxidicoccus parkwayensis]|uniref:Uncharacterized protein n=1 Tax=Pyxidicoccus parkwayensis TaxID=2813578 RepID=A0ABX7NT27_9BACT|nr:hypothetical protein [Pyxidicoccus parkwaysis]QSQ21935.1 hypothetical protein JY651_43460 [Pyxidicoccus parkwaysis]
MNAGRMAVLLVWSLMGTALAADSEHGDEDLSKQSTGLIQARMSTEQKRLESAESELTVLGHELQKARARQAEVQAQKLDTVKLAPLLARFQKDFTAVTDATAKGGLPTKDAYSRLERSANELYDAMVFALADLMPRYFDEAQRIPLLDELYGEPRRSQLPSASELLVLRLPQATRDSGMTPDVFIDQMKEALASAAERARTLSIGELDKLFTQDQEAATKVWQGVIDRTQVAMEVRSKQVKDSQTAIDALSAELDARQVKKFETDGRLTWAIIIMVIVLLLLYLATLLFKPEVQQTIFNQRILVEMIGMAFLLLTIIILGTGEKIDRAVLGTLLGTVGGYIFGQQQARRNATDTQPAAQPTMVAVAPQPVQPVMTVVPTQPATRVSAEAATLEPSAPVNTAVPAQAATLLQQAAQQGGNPAPASEPAPAESEKRS